MCDCYYCITALGQDLGYYIAVTGLEVIKLFGYFGYILLPWYILSYIWKHR